MSDTERARVCAMEIQDILEKFGCGLEARPQLYMGQDGDIRVKAFVNIFVKSPAAEDVSFDDILEAVVVEDEEEDE